MSRVMPPPTGDVLQASLFPSPPAFPSAERKEQPTPQEARQRRKVRERRLAELRASAPPFVPPTVPCRHGGCRQDRDYLALPGRARAAAWCPGCPGHERLTRGRTRCLGGEPGHPGEEG